MLIRKNNIYSIPGWGFQANIFNTLNNEEFNFIGLDYINFSPFSLNGIARNISKALPDQAILLGWSFGGLIAIMLTFLFPKKVKKLILVASQPRLRSAPNWVGIDRNSAYDFEIALIRNFNKQMECFLRLACYPKSSSRINKALSQYLLYDRAGELEFLLKMLFEVDLRTEYHSLDVDILQLIGKQDAVIPQDITQLKKLNSRVTTTVFQNTGHVGFITNRSPYINAIKEFINNE